MKYTLIDDKCDEYVEQYNAIVKKYENIKWTKNAGLSFHHILPRAYFPQFKDDPKNWLYLPIMEHIKLHYLLWKHDSKYCAAFWFCYVYFHKNHGYNITDDELIQLKLDMKEYRHHKGGKV